MVPWLLACYLLAWGLSALALDRGYVGRCRDDGLYFVGAVSLAQGHGYRLPSRPDDPAASKYPIGFPLALAAAMKLSGNPSDLATQTFAAHLVIVICGGAFLLLSYLVLRRLRLRASWALVCVIFISLHPVYFAMSDLILSDFLYSSLAMATLLLAFGRTGSARQDPWRLFLAGVLIASAYYVRTIGIALLLGMALELTFPRRRSNLAWAICALGVMAAGIPLHLAAAASSSVSPDSSNYMHELAAVGENPGIWIMMILRNLKSLSMVFSEMLLPILTSRFAYQLQSSSRLLVLPPYLISDAILLIGLLRLIRGTWHRYIGIWTFAFFTIAIVMVWPWETQLRFYLALFPLVFLTFLTGSREIWSWFAASTRRGMGIALSLTAALGLLADIGLYHRIARELSKYRGALVGINDTRRELELVRRFVPPDAVVVDEYPELIYLYTNRQAVPMVEDEDYLTESYGRLDKLQAWARRAPGRNFYFVVVGPEQDQDPPITGFLKQRSAIQTIAKGPDFTVGIVRPYEE